MRFVKGFIPSLIVMLFVILWGNLTEYGNNYVVASGHKYYFSKNVVIDALPFARDGRGNVQIELDASGKARSVFFYGIDMPQVIRDYKR